MPRICQFCGKSYQSDPALRLHMKVKHNEVKSLDVDGDPTQDKLMALLNPESDQVITKSTMAIKRGRGRPCVSVTKRNNLEQFGIFGGTLDTQSGTEIANMQMDQRNAAFLRLDGRSGGPTDPFEHFEATVKLVFGEQYKDPKQHPMHDYLYSMSWKNTPRGEKPKAEKQERRSSDTSSEKQEE